MRNIWCDSSFWAAILFLPLAVQLSGGKATVGLSAGDHLRITTPGGGGYGEDECESLEVGEGGSKKRRLPLGSEHGVEKGSVLEYRRRQETA
jgi:hypothetical protein